MGKEDIRKKILDDLDKFYNAKAEECRENEAPCKKNYLCELAENNRVNFDCLHKKYAQCLYPKFAST